MVGVSGKDVEVGVEILDVDGDVGCCVNDSIHKLCAKKTIHVVLGGNGTKGFLY